MDYLLVGLGGFLGAILRYACGLWLAPWSEAQHFPLGHPGRQCARLLPDWLPQPLNRASWPAQRPTSLPYPGLLGGFTTFSAFGYETLARAETAGLSAAAGNIIANLGLGVLAVWCGRLLADAWLQ